MSLRNSVVDSLMRLMGRAHRTVIVATGGRLGWKLGHLLAIELVTIGRSSGEPRSTMLTSPVHRDGRFVLVASKGGDDRHPQWYLNLLEEPHVGILTRREVHRMTARTAAPEEKAALWPEIVRAYPGYALYQRKTERDIPVVVCEPRD